MGGSERTVNATAKFPTVFVFLVEQTTRLERPVRFLVLMVQVWFMLYPSSVVVPSSRNRLKLFSRSRVVESFEFVVVEAEVAVQRYRTEKRVSSINDPWPIGVEVVYLGAKMCFPRSFQKFNVSLNHLDS